MNNNNNNNKGSEEAKIATKLKWAEDQLKLKRNQLEKCRIAKRQAENTLRDLEERGIRPYHESHLVAEKKKELAQLTLDYDHLTNTYEDLRMTADYWQQRAHEQQIDSEKKVNELFEEHDKKVNELVEEHDKKVNDLAQEHDKKVNELVEEHNKKVNDLAQERDEKVNERDTIKEQFGNFAKAMSPVLRDLGGEVAVLQRRMQRTEHFCHNLANLIDNALQGAPPNGVLSDQAIQLLSTLTSPSVLVIVPANARPLDDADAAANDETH